MRYFDTERPETWPLQFFETSRLRAWPDGLLERVADQLAAVEQVTVELAFARLMVRTETERRDPASARATTLDVDGDLGLSENAA